MAKVCNRCNRPPTPEGFDACLGRLPGVKNACCGHGDPTCGYVQFENGVIIRGFFDHLDPGRLVELHGGIPETVISVDQDGEEYEALVHYFEEDPDPLPPLTQAGLIE